MTLANIIYIAIVFLVMALLWVHFLREKRPDPYKDIASRPVIPAVVIDFDMPFGSMVLFLAKLAIASIPAMLIVVVVLVTIFAAISAIGLARFL